MLRLLLAKSFQPIALILLASLSFAASLSSQELTITMTSVPDATVGQPYAATLEATGGTPPYTWEWVGLFPPPIGLQIVGNQIVGTPTGERGAFNTSLSFVSGGKATWYAQVRVQDSATPPATALPSTVINASGSPIDAIECFMYSDYKIATESIPNFCSGYEYPETTLLSEGGSGALQWELRNVLPAGISFDGTTFSGTPQTVNSPTPRLITVRLKDPNATVIRFVEQKYETTTYPSLSLETTELPTATVGVAYSQTLTSSGGSGPDNAEYTVDGLPSGLTFVDGVISGTPDLEAAMASPHTVTARLSDTELPYISIAKTFVLHVRNLLTLEQSQLPTALNGLAYHEMIAVSGGIAPLTVTVPSSTTDLQRRLLESFELQSDELRNGVVEWYLSSESVSAQTSSIDPHILEFEVTDSATPPLTAQFSIEIRILNQLALLDAALPTTIAGETYEHPLSIFGGTAPYNVILNGLPNELTYVFNAANDEWEITGNPTTVGTYVVDIACVDSSEPPLNFFERRSLQITSTPEARFSISTTTLPVATEGRFYGPVPLTANREASEVDWSESLGLPLGLEVSFDQSSGWSISGVPESTNNLIHQVQFVVYEKNAPLQRTSLIVPLAVGKSSGDTGGSSATPPPILSGSFQGSALVDNAAAAAACSLSKSSSKCPWWLVVIAALGYRLATRQRRNLNPQHH